MPKTETYKENNEFQPLSFEQVLAPGEALQVNTLLPKIGETPVVASIFTSRHRRSIEENQADYFNIIDIRNVYKNSNGTKEYAGYSFDPTVEYLVVSRDLNFDYGKGFKGLRSSEGEVIFGRYDGKLMSPNDYRSRFNTGPYSSRNHFSISVNKDGLLIKDTESTNGTTVFYDSSQPTLHDRGTNKHPAPKTKSSEHRVVNERLLNLINSHPDQYELTKRLANEADTAPVNEIDIDNNKFLLSPIQEGVRKFAVLYSQMNTEGMYAPRLLYKSNSEGGWRVVPYGVSRNGHLNKGLHVDYGGYTQETKLDDRLAKVLSDMENTAEMCIIPLRPHITMEFLIEDITDSDFDTYQDEIKIDFIGSTDFVGAYDLYKQSPGRGFVYDDMRSARDHFSELRLPPDLMPNFENRPTRIYKDNHAMLGNITTEVFEVNYLGRPIEWHVSSDKDGRVWIDKLKYKHAKINSYGSSSPIILAGLLNNKPIEYKQQTEGLQEYLDYDELKDSLSYVDITKLLDNLAVIKKYRLHRKIYRRV